MAERIDDPLRDRPARPDVDALTGLDERLDRLLVTEASGGSNFILSTRSAQNIVSIVREWIRTRATPANGEAAEGTAEPLVQTNDLRQWQHDLNVDGPTRRLCGRAADEIARLNRLLYLTAPPKPAPDAVRTALEAAKEQFRHIALGTDQRAGNGDNWAHTEAGKGFKAAEAALSAPVPSPDDPEPRWRWCSPLRFENTYDAEGFVTDARLVPVPSPGGVRDTAMLDWLEDGAVDSDGRENPVDTIYFDDGKIIDVGGSKNKGRGLRAAIATAMQNAGVVIRPSDAGAAESVARGSDAAEADRYFEMAGDFGNRIQRTIELIRFNIGSINRSVAAELNKVLSSPFPAAPPVMRDREVIENVAHWLAGHSFALTVGQPHREAAAKIADAVAACLSLPSPGRRLIHLARELAKEANEAPASETSESARRST